MLCCVGTYKTLCVDELTEVNEARFTRSVAQCPHLCVCVVSTVYAVSSLVCMVSSHTPSSILCVCMVSCTVSSLVCMVSSHTLSSLVYVCVWSVAQCPHSCVCVWSVAQCTLTQSCILLQTCITVSYKSLSTTCLPSYFIILNSVSIEMSCNIESVSDFTQVYHSESRHSQLARQPITHR